VVEGIEHEVFAFEIARAHSVQMQRVYPKRNIAEEGKGGGEGPVRQTKRKRLPLAVYSTTT
jgi:hypothetical protein